MNHVQNTKVPETMYIPLVSRIYTSEKFPKVLYDEIALDLKEKLNLDLIWDASNEYALLASATRSYHIDKFVVQFLDQNPGGNVINMGAGLETIFSRISSVKGNFYNIDLRESMDIRMQLIEDGEFEKSVEGDLFSEDWIKLIDTSLPTLIVYAGVFQYFEVDQIKNVLKCTSQAFKHVEVVFDSTNKAGLKFANDYVKKTGNHSAEMFFYIENIHEFCSDISGQARVLEVIDFYKEIRPILNGKIKISTYMMMFFCDILRRARIYHLKL
ncbi:class I SAM-dependent methyltransferase [Acidaminobacter sp. JC074]|uniref:class I SAM-dependent methyltransferase n=1 Tax=Acidaminobacter sp. JC074 TaxID=2530199 RepID=UPI001F112B97|nr:class I SAM-dependent methyltransferase [Acidaminobacter sp. JC074]